MRHWWWNLLDLLSPVSSGRGTRIALKYKNLNSTRLPHSCSQKTPMSCTSLTKWHLITKAHIWWQWPHRIMKKRQTIQRYCLWWTSSTCGKHLCQTIQTWPTKSTAPQCQFHSPLISRTATVTRNLCHCAIIALPSFLTRKKPNETACAKWADFRCKDKWRT